MSAFFYAQELFAAPIHWGFVLLGWATFAAGGLLVRIVEWTKVTGDAEAVRPSESIVALVRQDSLRNRTFS